MGNPSPDLSGSEPSPSNIEEWKRQLPRFLQGGTWINASTYPESGTLAERATWFKEHGLADYDDITEMKLHKNRNNDLVARVVAQGGKHLRGFILFHNGDDTQGIVAARFHYEQGTESFLNDNRLRISARDADAVLSELDDTYGFHTVYSPSDSPKSQASRLLQ